MNLKINPKIDLAAATAVKLAGVEYLMAPLAMRQLRVVVPLLAEAFPAIRRLKTVSGATLSEGDFTTMLTAVHAGLSRVYPALTLDDLLDEVISPEELAAATGAVALMTGVYKKTDENEMSDAAAAGSEAVETPGEPSTSTD